MTAPAQKEIAAMLLTTMGATRTARLEQTLIAAMFHALLIMSAIPPTIGGATAAGGLMSATATLVYAEWKIMIAELSV